MRKDGTPDGLFLMYKTKYSLYALSFFLLFNVLSCQALTTNTPLTDKGYISAPPKIVSLIKQVSELKDVPFAVMYEIVRLESNFDPNDDTGDGGLACGLVQIRSDFHPNFPCQKAKDPIIALNFLADGLLAGKCHSWWSTCPLGKGVEIHPPEVD